ncbi:SDR family oxidoreductase, partial [Xanthomonas campestris pv. asclepiadis]|uniref:SDR family NAD(P)-dependent oxidoreductase n=1 Tax=Xanthomonas campestris TaxID=339 RepID=UPI001E609DB3
SSWNLLGKGDEKIPLLASANGRGDYQATAVRADISIATEAQTLIEAAVTHFGRLDILVNNSGVWDVGMVEHMSEDQYRRLFDVNVLGMLLTTQAAIKHLKDEGSIVNISSSITTLRSPGTSLYTASKAAVNAISGVVAKELAPRKIRVNIVSPGFVITEGTTNAGIVGSQMADGIVAQTPLGRAGQPEDIASVVTFLASDDARFITGEEILVTGGLR